VLMKQVLKRVIISGQASTSMIQRRFSVGYARASRIVDQMESNRFIGPLEGSKPREVYITREQFRELFDEDVDDIS
jgi:S-DNA-T family DNA segregation ATPase FtsK/SpoIIIE